MNYRHHFHAGNFADVVKHVLLVQLLRAMQQKPKGLLYLDTHAGRGAYDLQRAAVGESLARTPEWPEGVGRLWARPDLPAPIADYLELVRRFDRDRGNLAPEVRFYPGSPWLAAMTLRPVDRMVLCEKHPAEFAALEQEFSGLELRRRQLAASVQATDGYVALRAVLPPPERRALILIDPPYEAQDEFARAAAGLREALRRFPTGVYALWYPLTQRARVEEFVAAILELNPPPTLLAELSIAPDESDRKLKGCGLIVLNPPWQFDAIARSMLQYLAPVLAQERGAARTTWLVPEA
jgi:23S rRNA (adenine2030-N6)-methyltransferase